MGKGATNKRKGSNTERYYAKVFREDLGFSFCKTSRQSNRMLDDAGIDLNFLPFNVQIKAGYNQGFNEFKTLKIIRERLPDLFPPYDDVHKKVDVLIHKKDGKKGKKRLETDELVFIWAKDYEKLFNPTSYELKKFFSLPKKIGQKRGWSFEEELQKHEMIIFQNKLKESLLVMSFEKFKQLIKTKEWQ